MIRIGGRGRGGGGAPPPPQISSLKIRITWRAWPYLMNNYPYGIFLKSEAFMQFQYVLLNNKFSFVWQFEDSCF
jgi:hypothetical protein